MPRVRQEGDEAMSGLLQEDIDMLDGEKRLQAVFGEKEGAELAELAIKLSRERYSSAPEFAWWMLMDAVQGSSFEQIRERWGAKPEKAVKR